MPALLQHGAQAHFTPIEDARAPSWTGRRTILIGDAAHATSPNMAQGAAMALEDAWALAEALDTSPGIDSALTEFEHRRRPRVGWIQEQTHRRDKIRGLPGMIRNIALRAAGERITASNYRLLQARP